MARAYVYDLAPVGGPDPATWSRDVRAAAQARTTDDSLPTYPPDTSAAATGGPTLEDLYRELAAGAGDSSSKAVGIRTAKEYARSAKAREAVLLRAQGACENPARAGMPCDVRPDGEAILDVDHVPRPRPQRSGQAVKHGRPLSQLPRLEDPRQG